MASPFHVFRKNQKAMIATLGLLAIGAFVFLTPIAMYYGGPGGKGESEKEDPVVVTTAKYGDLTRDDIGKMQNDQRVLWQFFYNLIRLSPKQDGRIYMINELFGNQGNMSERGVVYEWLQTRRAKELGMKINKDAISKFIFEMSDGKADDKTLKKMLEKYKLTNDRFYELLREKFMAKQMLQGSFGLSLLPGVTMFGDLYYQGTPGQCWDYFQRANRSVRLYFKKVVVDECKKEVDKPTEEEIVELFEAYKDKPEDPKSPEPGFLVPEKVKIEYIEVDPNLFAKVELVTPKEVDEYYKKNEKLYPVRETSEAAKEKEPKTTEPKTTEPKTTEPKTTEPKTTEGEKPKESTATAEKTRKGVDGFYDSLDDAKKDIREKLAVDKDRVLERAKKALKKVKDEIKDERVEKIKQGGKASPDAMEEKADEHKDWNHDVTDLLTYKELFAHKVGQSSESGSKLLANEAFKQDKMSKTDMKVTEGKGENPKVYLVRKVKHAKPTVSSLKDPEVRKKVIEAAIVKKARKAAERKAEELAEAARKSGKTSLKAAIAEKEGVTVLATGYFTWFDKTVSGYVVKENDRVPGIKEFVDSDFMRTVYGLELNEIAVVKDKAQNVYYVIQLIDSVLNTPPNTPPNTSPNVKANTESLWLMFQNTPYMDYYITSRPDFREVNKAWIEQLEKDAGLKWKRAPLPAGQRK